MSNVVPFRRHKPLAPPVGCDVVSVADDLLTMLDDVHALATRAAAMNRPAIEIERTVQNLLDAVGALERAVDGLGEGGLSEGGLGENSGPSSA